MEYTSVIVSEGTYRGVQFRAVIVSEGTDIGVHFRSVIVSQWRDWIDRQLAVRHKLTEMI